MNLFNRRIISQLVLALAVCAGVIGLQAFAFTEPSSAPPAGNVAAPLNTSSTAQDKAAWITADGLGSRYGALFATLSGSVGIGTVSPAGKLDVEGGNLCLNGSCISAWPSGGSGSNSLAGVTNCAKGQSIVSDGQGGLTCGSGLGAWQTLSMGTTYQAATDGFALGTCNNNSAAYGGTSGGNNYIIGYTDSSNGTTQKIESYNLYWASAAMPVKKGDYWKMVCYASVSSWLYWIPLGS